MFERFPGIGPRQAGRFVHFLLRSSPSLRRELAKEIQNLGGAIKQCADCRRFFGGANDRCAICASPRRERETLMVVISDSDVDAIDHAGSYNGLYFVLGGSTQFGSDKQSVPNERALVESLKTHLSEIQEIIFALPANPEGDSTEQHVRALFAPILKESDVRITVLGRGLSTGSELEYADAETIKNALKNRT